jgi:hypothetical protein
LRGYPRKKGFRFNPLREDLTPRFTARGEPENLASSRILLGQ